MVADSTALWQTSGRLRDMAPELYWFCACSANPAKTVAVDGDAGRTVEIGAILRHGWGVNEDRQSDSGHVRIFWPLNLKAPAAAVFVWVVGDVVAAIDVRAVPVPETHPAFSVQVTRRFSPSDADRCRVGVAWICDGRLVAPKPAFDGPGGAELVTALALDDAETLVRALEKGALLTAVGSDGAPLVRRAVSMGASKVVAEMIRRSPELRNVRTPTGYSLLYLAAEQGRVSMVDALLRSGVSTRPKGKTPEMTPMMAAAAHGHSAVIAALAKAGAPVNESHGWVPSSPIDAAIEAGALPAVRQLAALGATLPADPRLAQLLIGAAEKGDADVVEWLLEHGRKSAIKLGADLALGAVVRRGHKPALCASLLAAGARGDAVLGAYSNAEGETALTVAARSGHEELVRVLLDGGAAINSRNKLGRTPLHLAAIANQPHIVRLLLDRGADPALTDPDARTPLESAIVGASPDAAELLAASWRTRDADSAKIDPLLEAAIGQDLVAVVKSLMGDREAAQLPMIAGWTALELAEACGAEKVGGFLRERYGSVPGRHRIAEVKALDRAPLLTRSAPVDGAMQWERCTLQVSVLIDADGRIRVPRILNRPQGGRLAPVLESLATWRFAPPTSRQESVAVRVVLPLQLGGEDRSVFSVHNVDEPPAFVGGENAAGGGEGDGAWVRITVNAQGVVQDASPVDVKVAPACLAAARRLRFTPGIHHGKPVNVSMVVRVHPEP